MRRKNKDGGSLKEQEGNRTMFVGGEFYYDERWLLNKPALATENMTFLNGGKACLMVISDYLRDHGSNKILLPAYLCPTIVTTLESCGLTCDYYSIHPDFSIDLDDLDQKMVHHRAVYFINYFGFLHPPALRNYLASLRQKGVIVIEDNAQAGFTEQPGGDFIFNSMRKLAAYDGGYLIAPFDITSYVKKYHGCPNRRLPVIREYRSRLAEYLYQGTDIYNELVEMYELAEYYYETDTVVEGDPQEREGIERLDWDGIRQARRKNYTYLLGLIEGIQELTPVFQNLQEDNMPLGLPVYVEGISRDWLLDELGAAGIGLNVHWHELLSDPRLNGNAMAVEMAGKILTLAIDQRTSRTQMDYMVEILMDCIRNAKLDSGQQ
jgi:dTDP-4-amino-4,6-dideoxygalactose transaminase